ncbi:N-acetyltransferase [Gloeocapsopsis crepidinum LEGE 06123]|uniref:N-acetyltransferase n=2 Tax=Gloeocapsopsis crepidinum TaxID=693223 RepID=A0ABR9UWX0_9CHRO|nr:N-acetyltransferase [Gloeocapsopsis crepidinum LEGE 06123]
MDYVIRNEKIEDYKIVEELTRKAFWNIYVPGCKEHYLVHVMRKHKDFIPELDYVIEKDKKIIGNIMYTKAKLVSGNGREKLISTFGPVSILPEYQRRGFGKRLIEHSFMKAKELKCEAIVIFGNPSNYVNLGFKSSSRFDISLEDEIYPSAMLAKELIEGSLKGERWIYKDSDVYKIDEKKAEEFDLEFEKMEKKIQGSQEEFYILSNSRIIRNSI